MLNEILKKAKGKGTQVKMGTMCHYIIQLSMFSSVTSCMEVNSFTYLNCVPSHPTIKLFQKHSQTYAIKRLEPVHQDQRLKSTLGSHGTSQVGHSMISILGGKTAFHGTCLVGQGVTITIQSLQTNQVPISVTTQESSNYILSSHLILCQNYLSKWDPLFYPHFLTLVPFLSIPYLNH